MSLSLRRKWSPAAFDNPWVTGTKAVRAVSTRLDGPESSPDDSFGTRHGSLRSISGPFARRLPPEGCGVAHRLL
jgi:hypothetical protein